MFTIQWNDSSSVKEAICVKSEDAWNIYWALKKSMEKQRLLQDNWIQIWLNGTPCNPERGGQLPACRKGENTVFILKKAEESDVRGT